MKHRKRRQIAVCLILLLICINAVAFLQAWSMTHFVPGGTRTRPPEELSRAQKLWVLLTGVQIPRPVNRLTPSDIGLVFSVRHVQSSDLDLETWSIPALSKSRGLVLMYHAYVAAKSTMLPAAQQFHQLGYALEMIDFRGSGGSGGNATTIGYREADDVAATVVDARKNLLEAGEPLILYGQSMGAAATLRAVGDLGVSPDAIIIESPYDRLLSTAANRFHAMHLAAFPLAQLLIFWGGTQQGYWGFGMNPAESAKRVHCPVLMFHGQQDLRVTDAQAADIFNNLGGPKVLESYAGAAHLAFLSTDAGRWTGSVNQFLKRYTKPGPAGQ